ncbi:MAG: FprA family A-type flavoprotein [Firmicutes bacterium]|nr:FprA family A-type flavoprotein [Bacillota bacterium]
MKPVKLKENIYWVGAIDWDVRNFHGYLTQKGTTYNAYLIVDKKIVLIDTVKNHLFGEMISRISEVVDPGKIEYVVSNHVEMDHSGSIPELMKIAPNAAVVSSPKGKAGLQAHYKKNWRFITVNTGDALNIGERNINFIHTPMVHWPDNMVSFIPEEKILFSNDAFGQHIASSERFDDEFPLDVLLEEASKYYANIVLPYGAQVQNIFGKLADLNIDIIAPSHGLIWRSKVLQVLEQYQKWSSSNIDEKAVIVYDTMWNSTEKIAYAVQAAFENKGITTKMMTLKNNHISDIMTHILTAKYICVGSPTLNNNMLPTVAGFLTYLKGLAPKNRVGLAFGSYGWSGQSIGQVEDVLKGCGFSLIEKISVQYVPEESQLEKITQKVEEAIH